MNVMSRTPINSPKAPDLSLRYTPVKVDKGFICNIENPDPANGLVLPGPTGHVTLSVQPNGTLETRTEGTAAQFEVCTIDGAGSVTFWPGRAWPQNEGIPQEDRGTCYKFLGAVNVPDTL
jgi:hypothetical protein